MNKSEIKPVLMSFEDVCALLGMKTGRDSRLFFWRGAKNGTFPAPVKLGAAKIAWRASEIEAFVQNLKPAEYTSAN